MMPYVFLFADLEYAERAGLLGEPLFLLGRKRKGPESSFSSPLGNCLPCPGQFQCTLKSPLFQLVAMAEEDAVHAMVRLGPPVLAADG